MVCLRVPLLVLFELLIRMCIRAKTDVNEVNEKTLHNVRDKGKMK